MDPREEELINTRRGLERVAELLKAEKAKLQEEVRKVKEALHARTLEKKEETEGNGSGSRVAEVVERSTESLTMGHTSTSSAPNPRVVEEEEVVKKKGRKRNKRNKRKKQDQSIVIVVENENQTQDTCRLVESARDTTGADIRAADQSCPETSANSASASD